LPQPCPCEDGGEPAHGPPTAAVIAFPLSRCLSESWKLVLTMHKACRSGKGPATPATLAGRARVCATWWEATGAKDWRGCFQDITLLLMALLTALYTWASAERVRRSWALGVYRPSVQPGGPCSSGRSKGGRGASHPEACGRDTGYGKGSFRKHSPATVSGELTKREQFLHPEWPGAPRRRPQWRAPDMGYPPGCNSPGWFHQAVRYLGRCVLRAFHERLMPALSFNICSKRLNRC
jgi:hypothetical protein